MEKLRKNWILYTSILILSALFLFIGNRIASSNSTNIREDMYEPTFFSGVVTEIIDRIEETFDFDWDFDFTNYFLIFNMRITSGDLRGETVTAEQQISSFFMDDQREVEPVHTTA